MVRTADQHESSSRGFDIQFDLILSLASVCVFQVVDFSAGVAVNELELVSVEVYFEQFLVEFDEGDQTGIEAHFDALSDLIAPDVGHHYHLDFLVAFRHYNYYQSINQSYLNSQLLWIFFPNF